MIDWNEIVIVFMTFAMGGCIAVSVILAVGFSKRSRLNALAKQGALGKDETQAFQELERGFRRMGERVEALETLIIERSAEDREKSFAASE